MKTKRPAAGFAGRALNLIHVIPGLEGRTSDVTGQRDSHAIMHRYLCVKLCFRDADLIIFLIPVDLLCFIASGKLYPELEFVIQVIKKKYAEFML